MAFDSALHYLDELKDKYMHEVEKAIDDWDYQDFSPDKRTPLLENEIAGDAPEDLASEPNALQQIKDPAALDWTGLNRDEMLADQAFGRRASATNTGVAFEARVVAMATPPGGVHGIPDADALQRFLHHAAAVMNPHALADAFMTRLHQSTWQIRAKTLVLMEIMLKSPDLVGLYLPALRTHAILLQTIDNIRTQDRSAIARENARKVLSLIRSNGADAMLVAREHIVAKPHGRHSPMAKKKSDALSKPTLTVQTATTTINAKKVRTPQALTTSPKIAAAALASHRRRSQKDVGSTDKIVSPLPAPVVRALERKDSARSSTFAFVDQPPLSPPQQQQQQQRVSITTAQTQMVC